MSLRPGRLVTLVAAPIAVGALAAGCVQPATGVARTAALPRSASVTASAPAGPPAVVPAALTFTATTLDGKAFDAATLAGRPVILWFWAPWCAVCFGQAATVTDLASQYSGRVSLVGVAGLDRSTAAMKDFVSQAEVGNVPHLNDRTGALWKRFGIKEQSTFVMINRAGQVMQTGFQDSVTLSDWAAYLDRN
jgi:thiol-disulfide isomerase/thioredoxin